MKDDIKEILNKLRSDDYYEKEYQKSAYYERDLKKLEDYITNLQEENERLKNGYCELKVKCNNGECDCTNEEYEDMAQANMRGSLLLDNYKSRIEKAIEYIEEDILNEKIEKVDWDFDDCYFSDMPTERIKPLIDILQGVGKE